MNRIKQIGIAAVVGLLFIVVFFKPIFFEGKHLTQHDLLQGRGAGKEINDFRQETGKEALWTNSMFGGMPMYLVSARFSGNWVQNINYQVFRFLPATADVIFVNFICMFILLLTFRQNVWVSLLGGLLYGFSTFTLLSVEAGHIYKVLAMGYAPLVLAGMTLVFRGKYLLGGAVSALAISLELTSKHYQITFYFIIVALSYLISLLFFKYKKDGIKLLWQPVLVLVCAGVLALGPNVGDVWSTLDYSKVSIRGEKELSPLTLSGEENVKSGLDKNYAFAWSQGKWESFTFLIPNLYGGSSSEKLSRDSETYKAVYKATRSKKKSREFTSSLPTYWGPQTSTGGPHYASVVIVFFFVLGCFILKPSVKYWLLSALGITLMIGWGNNFLSFNYFLFDYIPGFNKFRAVAMALTLTTMLLVLMGTLAFGEILKEGALDKYKKQIKLAFYTTGGLIVFVWIGTLMMDFVANSDARFEGDMSWILDPLREDRMTMLNNGALRSLLFVGLVGVVIWLLSNKRVSQNVATYLILSLAVLDITMVNWKYLGHKDKSYTKKTLSTSFKPSKADIEILKDKSFDYRVLDLNNPFNNSLPSYYHKSIGGYSGVKMQRYQDLIERQITREMNNIITVLQNQGSGLENAFSENQVLNMLNTKYVIYNPDALPLKNEFCNGNVWLVKNVKEVHTADEEMMGLNQNDLKSTALIDVEKFNVKQKAFSGEGQVKMIAYEPNHLVYESVTANEEFAVFSEVYYDKGWNAYLDGEKAPYVRTDYILRGMIIPRGKHKVEFKFEPRSYFVGNNIALGSSILLVFLLLLGIGKSFLDSKKSNE